MLHRCPTFNAALVSVGFASAVLATSEENPADVPVIRSARSGAWSDPATWEGAKVPAGGVKVLVRQGHTVTYDVDAAESVVIRSLHIAGMVTFAPETMTRLNVGLIKIEDSDSTDEEGFDCDAHTEEPSPDRPRPALLVGTPERPIAAGQSALIRLHYLPGLKKESCPAIVCCGGRMDFHGAPLSRTWVKLGATADKGAREVTLNEPVSGWRVGDAIVVTTTQHNQTKENFNEERTIAALDGNVVRFDEPLAYAHQGEGENRGEVANLSRTVVV